MAIATVDWTVAPTGKLFSALRGKACHMNATRPLTLTMTYTSLFVGLDFGHSGVFVELSLLLEIETPSRPNDRRSHKYSHRSV